VLRDIAALFGVHFRIVHLATSHHARARRFSSTLAGTVAHIGFIGTRSTFAISLCETELASPSSQEMVTSLQDVAITVPRSVVAVPQQTRSPTLSPLDWSPVMGAVPTIVVVSVQSIGVIAISSPGLSDEPSSFVNIELYQTFASHFQQEGLAGFLIHDIGAFHDLIDFERLLAERPQDILSVI
jgi:hypothetical protein